jgi:predicted ArsR family transcriptional regulator
VTERRLALFKALGDNTRYAIYLELARSPRPLTTADIAETLDLHPNTVRPHLERMREVGLLDVEAETTGAVGRPQHRYSLSSDAPSLGLEPPTFHILARMLLRLAGSARLTEEDAVDAGREQGEADAAAHVGSLPGAGVSAGSGIREAASAAGGLDAGTRANGRGQRCVDALVARLDALGFDPAIVQEGARATVAFTHCPFRDLAESEPDLVCGLHRGLVEGFVAVAGEDDAEVTSFHPLLDRAPCQMTLTLAGAGDRPVG